MLLGESFSGPLAGVIAQSPPLNMRGLILVASFMSNPHPVLLKLVNIMPIWLLSISPPQWLIDMLFMSKDTSSEVKKHFQAVVLQVPAKLLSYRLRQIDSLKFELRPIELPFAYIRAEQDRLVTANSLRKIKKAYPQLELFQVRGPHFLLQTNPQECAKLVAEFVEISGNCHQENNHETKN